MTDVIDGEFEEVNQVKPLTLAKFLEDMSRFPHESEIYVSVLGAGITIPIIEAITADTTNQETQETKKVTILMVPYLFARQACQMVEERIQEKEGH